MSSSVECRQCKKEITTYNFIKGRRVCVECRTKYRKQHYLDTKEHKAKYNLKYREINKEHITKYRNDYNKSDKAKYSQLKNRALKKHDKDFNISYEQYLNIVKENKCTYCKGTLPVNGYGLDRIDNGRGYSLNNVVPCCGRCNIIRGENLSHIQMILISPMLEIFRKQTNE
jgi:hypothetical protein